jgi:hypothetical protein
VTRKSKGDVCCEKFTCSCVLCVIHCNIVPLFDTFCPYRKTKHGPGPTSKPLRKIELSKNEKSMFFETSIMRRNA